MIKKLLVVICIFIFSSFAFAQPYGNEWINFSQNYYKIKIAKEGVYRIDYATLALAGIPVNTINPKNLQLFNKGKEQAIFINGESDNVFNTTDYVEFYAQPNDGRLDSILYTGTTFQPNPYYSLYSDTAVYFLTWNSAVNNKRFTTLKDTVFTGYTPSAYCLREVINGTGVQYFAGATASSGLGITDPQYTNTEGWFSSATLISNGQSGELNFTINTPNISLAGPPISITTAIMGASQDGTFQDDHHITIEYKNASGNYNTLSDFKFYGYKPFKFNYAIPQNLIGSTIDFRYTTVADLLTSANGRFAVSYINVLYPHTYNMENALFFNMLVPDASSQTKSFLNLTNINSGGATDTIRFFDLSNNLRILTARNSAGVRVLVPNAGGNKRCIVVADSKINKVTSINTVSFTNYKSLAVDSAYLIVTHRSLLSETNNYKTYRQSIAGGSHNVIVADADELVDQFAYGIAKSPLGIRNFAEYALDSFPTKPSYLFLIGKSIAAQTIRKGGVDYSACLVPTFGEPAADVMFTSFYNNGNLVPAIPTGRISAKTNADIKLYLDKVIEYESTPADEWKKRVLHFAGGGDQFENKLFRNFLDSYENTIKDTLFGGIVSTFSKTSSAPISINTTDSLKNLINGGVSLMTFFGHSSGQSWDVGIDKPSTYNNKGKYPLILSNGCYAGDIHKNYTTITNSTNSEEFIFTKDRGSIGFIASVSLGLSSVLDAYSSVLYKRMASKQYGQSIGKCIQKTIDDLKNISPTDIESKAGYLEMTLHGDPAIKLNHARLPDYRITSDDVSFNVTYKPDTFIVNAVCANVGMAINASYAVEVIRTFPNGKKATYTLQVKVPKYKETISIKMPVDYINGIGLNKFKITLDYLGAINELSEVNNSTMPDAELLLQGNVIIPVYPYEFAIIPNNTVTLKASTANAFAGMFNYKFQIDTTDAFNSPQLLTTLISSKGGVLQWTPPITLKDSVVYYWRVSPDSISPLITYNWRESSFQYIKGKRGWGQAHIFQFKNDGYQFVNYNKPQRRFDFVNDVKSITVQTGHFPFAAFGYQQFRINGEQLHVSGCGGAQFTFAIFNPIDAIPRKSYLTDAVNLLGQYQNKHCSPDPNRTFSVFEYENSSPVWSQRIKDFIDVIPTGYYVLCYSQQKHPFVQGIDSLHNWFTKFGANVYSVADTVPYIAWGVKGGAPNSATQVIGANQKSQIQFNTAVTTKWNDGYVSTPLIGPAYSWDSLFWRQRKLELGVTYDSIRLRVIGVKADGSENVLIQGLNPTAGDVALSSIIDAAIYPHIRLQAFIRDTANNDPAQLIRWQVIYAPVPEAAINQLAATTGGYILQNDTVQEGADLKFIYPIQNISEYAFTDSFLVTSWIEDYKGITHPLSNRLKKKPFAPGEVIIDTIGFNTQGYPNANMLWVEVNPIGQTKSQLEQYHFNNIVSVPFNVTGDRINPLLDVTFDGIHILDNDIVSAKPNILVQLKDENKFLALNNQNDFAVFIKKPSETLPEPVLFGSELTFTPAVLPKNSCKLNYTPKFDKDGVYEFTVQAKDRSGNESGALDYKIRFEVVNKSTITNVMNYPNPFSTATKFVFTLTGSEVPDKFKIQILTISGKVVREITREELGNIHIGRNITDYAWDGKDEFGDQLANGLYLYRVQTQINGKSIEQRTSGADSFFTNEYGKMYLIR